MLMPFRPDLSSVQTVNLVGSFSSADSKKKCRKFFRQCGAHANILVGYGLSEAELGITISDPESNDESVGYLLPGVKGKLWNGRGCGMGCDMLPCTKEDDSPKTIAPVKLSEEIENRLQSGEITEQKSWKFIKELNSYSGERLDAIALSDSSRDYTYRQIFDLWDKYAAVFSALDICSKNQSRAAMVGTCAVEPISALYALNMTGVSVSMIAFNDFNDIDIWKKIVTAEGITDALLNDVDSEPDFIRALVKEKEELGIRNIIVQNIAIAAGDDFSIADEHAHRKKQRDIRKIGGILFMDDLLKKHASHPVCFGSEASSEAAVIIHTSGTVSGIHKPVPHSDAGFNEAVARLVRDERFKSMMGRAVTVSGMDMSNSYALMDQIHLVLAFGGRLYVLPGKRPGMEMLDSLIRNKANIAFFAGLIFDVLLRLPFSIDLSALEFIIVGGSYISANAKKRYDRFLARNGAKTRIMIGYGLSEAGAACILAPEDRKDNAIGYPLSGVKVKLYDENDGKYFDPEDGPRTGVLHISSKSVSNGRIDDTVFFETEEIDGERYLNTYDLVRVGRDGALYYTGRMNKYFVNNEGVRFDAGLVETAVSAEAGIEACGLAPEYEKVLHDTIPVLYVKAATDKRNSLKTVREALINVFVRQNIIEKTNLPSICVITDDIPLNEMGKVDTYRIRKGESKGRRFSVMPVKRDGLLISVDLVPQAGDEGGPGFGFGVPEELEDSVINMRGSFKKR
jgi:acyl-coenzyme A synthetase/AMP-(fatty) acid ligase